MKHLVPHDLGRDKAKEVTQKAMDSYVQQFADYKPQARWTGDHSAEIQFTAKGFTLKGTLEVQDTAIEMDLSVPFLLKPIQGRAIGVIESEIKTWIQKAKQGEL